MTLLVIAGCAVCLVVGFLAGQRYEAIVQGCLGRLSSTCPRYGERES